MRRHGRSPLTCIDQILKKRHHCHLTNPSRDRRDGGGDSLDRFKIHVSRERIIVFPIDADIDDYCSVFDVLRSDQTGPADSHDEDIRFFRLCDEIFSLAMADDYISTRTPAKLSYRRSHQGRPTDDHDILGFEIDMIIIQKLHDASCRGWNDSGLTATGKLILIARGQTIYIFARIDSVDDPIAIRL